MHANNVSHFAIHAGDVGRAKTFYENVFGWRFEEWGPPDFYLIKTGNEQSPGILGALQKGPNHWGLGATDMNVPFPSLTSKKPKQASSRTVVRSWSSLSKSQL